MGANGTDEIDGPLLDRLIDMMRGNRGALRDFSASLSESSARREREYEKICERLERIERRIDLLGKDVDQVKEDTDPNGHRRFSSVELESHQDKEGGLVTVARVLENVPPAWWAHALKFLYPALAIGAGAGLHWLALHFSVH